MHNRDLRMVTIYSLSNPKNDEVFYVGRTTLPLPRRLTSHNIHADGTAEYVIYLYELNKLGLRPKIEYVDTCSWDDRKKIEEFWIQTFSSWGFPLTNRRHVKNKNWEPYKEKQRKRVRSFILKTVEPEIIDLIHLIYDPFDCMQLAASLGCTKERIRGMLDKFIRLKLNKLMEWVKPTIEQFYLNKGKMISEAYIKTMKYV